MSEPERRAPMLPRSQLRHLAREFHAGELDEGEYRRKRRSLIDAIVDGDLRIERTPVRDPPPASATPPPLVAPRTASQHERFSPLHALIGMAVMAALVAVGLLIWPEPAPEPQATTAADGPQLPQRAVSQARTLVESFLAVRDWSESAVDAFETRWAALPRGEREGARTASWYRRMTTAVRDEIKTQKALAEFDESGAAAATSERLAAIRERLGAGATPAARAAPAPPPTGAATASEPPAPAASPPAASTPLDAPASAPATPAPAPSRARAPSERIAPSVAASAAPAPSTSVSALAPAPRGGGNVWAAGQPPGAFTVQLFALDRLDRIERLMTTHPSIPFRVIASDETTPRYRVLLGSYATVTDARAAHARLPEAVRRNQPVPLVKTFAELRERAAAPPSTRSGDWLARAGRDHFTLQLFASDRRESVERLVAGNPDVELQIVRTREGRSLYRVVHGVYPSTSAAVSASSRLPPALLRSIGKPLVKSIAELQDARDG